MIKHRLSQIKRYRLAQIFILATCYLLLATYCCFAKPVSSIDLIEHAKDYDGKIVSFQGEVVGDIMQRGDFAWVNMHDGKSAVGIWLKIDLTKNISYKGNYKFIGDTVEVKGKFNRACLEHGGDLDIHADSLTIIKKGLSLEERIDIQKYKATLGLLGVVICLGILRILINKRRKT